MSNERVIRKIEGKKKKVKPKRKRGKILGPFFIIIFLGVLSGLIYYAYKHPVLINTNDTKVSAESKYDPQEAISFVFFGSKDDVKVKTNVDTNKLGSYKTTYSYKNYSITVPVEVIDDVPPVLVLQEYTTDEVEKVDPNTFIKEVKDISDVEAFIKSEKKVKKGEFIITLVAEDSFGNKTVESVSLFRKKDTAAPVFASNIPDAITYEGENYNYLDVPVKDDLDNNPTIETNADDVITGSGDFVITYTATDRSGNTSQADRIVHVEQVPEEDLKIVYLTFDDGPSNNTEKVLDILAKYRVKATFFVTGNGQNRNDLIQREYNEGHTVGLHTYSHDYSIYQSEETYFNDLQAVSDMVYELTGYRSNIIRFPGGSSNTVSANYSEGIMSHLVNAVTERGYYYFDWNISSTDANGNNVDVNQIIENSNSGDAYSHIVLLMHDTDAKDTTVEALPEVIEHYQSLGYIFKGLSYRSPECHHGVNN